MKIISHLTRLVLRSIEYFFSIFRQLFKDEWDSMRDYLLVLLLFYPHQTIIIFYLSCTNTFVQKISRDLSLLFEVFSYSITWWKIEKRQKQSVDNKLSWEWSTQRFPLDRFSLILHISNSYWQKPLMAFCVKRQDNFTWVRRAWRIMKKNCRKVSKATRNRSLIPNWNWIWRKMHLWVKS